MRSTNKSHTSIFNHEAILRLFLIVFILSSFSKVYPQSASAENQKTLQTNILPVPKTDALVNVSVNEFEFGDVAVKLDEGAPFLMKTLLTEMLTPVLPADLLVEFFQVVFMNLEWIGPEDLKVVGIESAWDLSTLHYTLIVPTSFTSLRDMDFSPDTILEGKRFVSTSVFSSVLNITSGFASILSSTATSLTGSVDLDMLVKIGDVAIEGAGSVSWVDPNFEFSHSKVRALYDIPAAEGRLLVGRVTAEGTSYQTRPEILGISFGSVYTFSKYDRIASPSISFSLEEPSAIKILINGFPVRSMRLERGRYRFFDLPFSAGLNTIEIVVTDAAGNEKLLTPNQALIAAEGGILVSGQSEFGLSAGVGYFDLTELFISGFYKYGVDYRLTLSGFFQADFRSILGGVAIIRGSPIGIFSTETAFIYAWDGREFPFTYAGNFRYSLSIPSIPAFPNFSIFAEYLSAGFLPPSPVANPEDTEDPYLRVLATIGGMIRQRFYYNLSGVWKREFSTPLHDRLSFDINLGLTTGKGVSISLTTGLNLENSIPALDITISALIRPLKRPDANLIMTQMGGGDSVVSYSDKIKLAGGIDYSLQGQNILIGSPERKRLNATARKLTSIAEVSINGGINLGGISEAPDGTISGKVSSSIAYAEGVFALSRPLYDSYVILLPADNPNAGAVSLTTGSAGTIKAQKMPVALSLASYRQTIARADFPDSDANIIASIPEAILSPSYRSGIVFRVEAKKQLSVTGRLVDSTNKPYAYVAGDIFDKDGNKVEAVFTYEDGSFLAYSMIPGSYYIEWPPGIGVSRFSVPDDAEDFFELGEVFAETIEENPG